MTSRRDSRNLGGRPATGKGTPVVVRLQPDTLAKLDAWMVAQGDGPSRPEAVRRMIDLCCPHKIRYQFANTPLGRIAQAHFNRGLEYLNSAVLIQSNFGLEQLSPAYFCACHSIELFLKAFLAAKGVKRNKRQTHCLDCLLSDAKKKGLMIDGIEDIENIILHISEYTLLHRYPDFLMLNVLKIEEVIDLANKLRARVEAVSLSAFFKELKPGQTYERDTFSHIADPEI